MMAVGRTRFPIVWGRVGFRVPSSEHRVPPRPSLFVSLATILAFGATASGDDGEANQLDLDAMGRDRPRVDVTLGIWFPRLEGQVVLGTGGTEFDAGSDFGLDDADTIFNGEFQVEWDRWQILFGGYVVNTGGDAVLDRNAIVRGRAVPAGTAVASSVRAWSIDAEASWAVYTPYRDRRFPWSPQGTSTDEASPIDLVLQGVLGTRVVNLDQRYDFENVDVVESDRAWFIPWAGIGCEVDWSTRRSLGLFDRLVFDVTAGWGPALSGGDGSLTVRADITTYITPDLGITLGYRLNDWSLSRDGDTFDGGLQGLYAGVRLAW